ncbi:hypothetical protein HU200_029960 [Digitaria exilis]|uniref:F-box domain-containing protein n=1 Tax=Digitaria exilis TaxID=1010633 RepID=A0A835BS10_9POAL|nr:hypothetical protein HU200_029960 [Digitaria exilis]
MKSTMDDDVDEAAATRQTERRSPPACQAAIAGDDLLSGLCYDVFVRILGLAEHATDAVRTGVLSRPLAPLLLAAVVHHAREASHALRYPSQAAKPAAPDLSLVRMGGMRSLELRTPSLRVLSVKCCHDLESLVAEAPRLELDMLSCKENSRLPPIDQNFFPFVSRLKLNLCSHRRHEDFGDMINLASILDSCSSAARPEACLLIFMFYRIEPEPASFWGYDCAARLLISFNNLRYLRLDFDCFFNIKEGQSALCHESVWKSNFICDHWKSHEMSFVHLMETEFMGITGTDCELRFFQYVISDATYNYFRRPSYVSMRSTRWRAVKIFATCYSVAAHGPTAVPLTKNENGGTHTSGGSVVKTYLLDEQPSCMFCLRYLQQLQRKNARPLDEGRYRYHETLRRSRLDSSAPIDPTIWRPAMESAGYVDETKPTASCDDDHADRISTLPDDVLVSILRLVGDNDATELVRTGALSRRWRGLWTRVAALRFDAGPEHLSPGDAERFIGFVDGVLARHAKVPAGPGIEQLGIFLNLHYAPGEPHVPATTVEAVEGWIRYAVEQGLTSFAFVVRVTSTRWLLDDDEDDDGHGHGVKGDDLDDEKEEEDSNEDEKEEEENDEEEEGKELKEEDDEEEEDSYNDDEGDGEDTPVVALDDLPSSTKLETLLLFLGGAGLRLPHAAVFTSLTDLALQCFEIAADGGDLGRLLSPACCPRLEKLRLWAVKFKRVRAKELVLDTGTLMELTMYGMESLELRAPNDPTFVFSKSRAATSSSGSRFRPPASSTSSSRATACSLAPSMTWTCRACAASGLAWSLICSKTVILTIRVSPS